MTARKSGQAPTSVSMYTFVGNVGCIRFPQPIRKASGIKRGDRLVVNVLGPDTVRLEKRAAVAQTDVAGVADVRVEGCACANPPETCRQGETSVVTVGWSYVQLNEALAFELGFLPDQPIQLVGEPSQITVSLHHNLQDLVGLPHVTCPP